MPTGRAGRRSRPQLEAAVEQAAKFGTRLHWVNSSRKGQYVDPNFASQKDLADVRRVLDDRGSYEAERVVSGEDAWEDVLHAARGSPVAVCDPVSVGLGAVLQRVHHW